MSLRQIFIPGVRARRQQHKAKEELACILTSPPKLLGGSWESFSGGVHVGSMNSFSSALFQCHWGRRL